MNNFKETTLQLNKPQLEQLLSALQECADEFTGMKAYSAFMVNRKRLQTALEQRMEIIQSYIQDNDVSIDEQGRLDMDQTSNKHAKNLNELIAQQDDVDVKVLEWEDVEQEEDVKPTILFRLDWMIELEE